MLQCRSTFRGQHSAWVAMLQVGFEMTAISEHRAEFAVGRLMAFAQIVRQLPSIEIDDGRVPGGIKDEQPGEVVRSHVRDLGGQP